MNPVSDVDQQSAIVELQRVAASLNTRTLSRSTFAKHATISAAGVEAAFGSWNEAIVAAGLIPLPQGGLPKAEQRRIDRLTMPAAGGVPQLASDAELLDDLVRLANTLGRRPSGNQIEAKGKYPSDRYRKRWGSIQRAYEAALQRQQPKPT